MKREVKVRTVDIWKALPVVRSLEDAEQRGNNGDDDDDMMQQQQAPTPRVRGLERSSSTSNNGAPAPASLESAKGVTATGLVQPKAKEIPVPQIDTSAEYDSVMVEASFKLPESYIRTKRLPLLPPGVEIEGLEYNLELEDEEWLNGHKVIGPSGEMAGAVDADRMEKMMDELEKATGAGETTPLADAESVLEARLGMQPIGSNKTVIAEVWGYWAAKRARLKKPLLRRFWPVTSINDSNPHLVFRPREKEKYKLRKHRKNDGEAYRRLQLLRRDFGQVQHLLNMVRKREQVKLARLKLQEEQYLQTIAEMCGQTRKPKIPKDSMYTGREGGGGGDFKLKIRLPSMGMAVGEDGRPRKKRVRDDMDGMEAGGGGGRRGQPPVELNPEQERLRKAVACGFREREAAMATPDYLPSFMEEFKFRHQGLAALPPAHRTNKSFLPFADEASTTYAWRASRQGQGGKIGHVRSGLVAAPRCPPIDYDGEEDTSIRYRCRARLARGGRIVFDRVPIAPGLPAPLTLAAGGRGGEGEGGAAAAAREEENPAVDHSATTPLGSSVLLSAGTKLPHLDRYPTVDLVAGSLFQYPKRYLEISQLLDDTEEEVLEINPAAPSDPDSLLVLPPRPKPPETDAVVILRFALPV
eukprot:evm.model.NODE_2948_length_7831_cov_34.177883.2